MGNDFYCEQVLSNKIEVKKVYETENVLAYYHTKPAYEKHIVVIPKRHIASLITLTDNEDDLLLELLSVVKKVAAEIVDEDGACRVITNLGKYQDSKHLHFHLVYGSRK
ncbi:HIT domain-containing protein [Clostridium senegalense]|uniref:HIT domain-containing protein n=1 Tax=Clostridium senegalense TaxID=1465809 RepID=UPI001C102587|nr:HIT domain-containing protein [Clostridium senegalense]MBU5226799.1 HIT domain-containing protein [Clostridium senegalense]